jgi:hypothetical protein
LLSSTTFFPMHCCTARTAPQIARLRRSILLALARSNAAVCLLAHGDFYPSNVLISGTGDQIRIRPVDWELAAVGPGFIDLASLMTGLGGRQQRALLEAYRADAPDGASKSARIPSDWLVELDSCRLPTECSGGPLRGRRRRGMLAIDWMKPSGSPIACVYTRRAERTERSTT